MSIEARRRVLRLLESGPRTPDELRVLILGERPKDSEEQVEYKTRYQALRRALLDLVEEGVIEDTKYRLTGEGADQKFIQASMRRFDKTNDPARQRLLMEDIEAESGKRDAIFAPRLLMFLAKRLTDKCEELRKKAIRCLSNIGRRIDESRREDAASLLRMRKQCGRKLLDAVMQDPSIEVRKEALKLLVYLGETQTISLVENIIKNTTTEEFREFRSILKQYLVQPYATNRLLKAHKDALRDMLENLALGDDQRLAKRATVVLWSLGHGQGDMPGGEADIQ
jgi:hypothetical protein